MMMLSAVVLLVGFLALAGMVARVNQLGTQTGIESRQAVLEEAGPLKRSIDNGLARLSLRSATTCCTWAAGGAITASSALFTAADVGLSINGTGIPANARITSIASSTQATISPAPATARSTATTLALWKPGFALTASTTPSAEAAAIAMLEQMQRMEAGHGLWLDWQIGCVGADPTKGQVVTSLSDGTVWLEVRSAITFPRADCTTVTG